MNDPGLDGTVNQVSRDLEENPYQHLQKQEEEEEENFLDPSRWWFASTACPLIAGTFGPMANAFSICALVQSWRIYIPPGQTEVTGEHIKDPSWLIGINAASLGLALIANLALLLNMARRIAFAIAQSITIVGFLVAAFLLIGLLGAASSRSFRLDPPDQHALSQAFYYGIIAAGLYVIIALLMIVTVWGAYSGHYEKEFRLTVSQRTLMLQTIMFMMYLLLGACIYTYIEDWQYLDAVYWADFTLLTVGIGDDFTPQTHLGRSLLFPYAIGGIITVGLVVGSIRTLVLERGKAKMQARMTEKRRERVLSTVNFEKRTVKVGLFRKIEFDQTGLTEPQRREQEFHLMRKIQKDSSTIRSWLALFASTLAACILWFIGALVFWYSEESQGWSYFVSLYFSYTSLLTIGYGDFQPASNSGRPFFVFWSLLAVPTLTILISNMGDTVVKIFSDLTIWLGSVTVLPGEGGVRASVKLSVKNARQRFFDPDDFRVEQPPGFLMRGGVFDGDKKSNKRRLHIDEITMKRVAQHLEDEELGEATEAEKEGDMLARDIHFYHYVLAREMRNLMRDVNESPPKQYDYAEWAYYLRLIGQDESDPELHRQPSVKPHTRRRNANGNDIGGDAIGTAGGQIRDPETPPSNEEQKEETEADGVRSEKWSWLGTRSPLMGSETEAEWLLGRISAALETNLKRNGVARGVHKVPPKPPISMTELVKKFQEREQERENERDSEEQDKKEQ